MNERELSKLWYIADALARNPLKWREILKAGRAGPIDVSESLEVALDALEKSLKQHSAELGGTGHAAALRVVAQDLLERQEPERDAGRALAWALENASSRRVMQA